MSHMDQTALGTLSEEIIDHRFKALSPHVHGQRVKDLVAGRPRLFDPVFEPPVMVLKETVLDANIREMARYCADNDLLLAPHGKTTLAPQLFQRQLAAGAWGISVATSSQVALCRAFGVSRVLLANELVNSAAAAWIGRELDADPLFDFYCYVDSVAGVDLLCAALTRTKIARAVNVFVEYGADRTGVRSGHEAVEVAAAAATCRHLRLVGVAGYEGGLGKSTDEDARSRVRLYLADLHRIAADLAERSLIDDDVSEVLVTAGGSAYFDDVAEVLKQPLARGRPSRVVLRSGSYITHDSGLYERISPFTRAGSSLGFSLNPAIEVWGELLSLPEPTLALVQLGKRDVAFDEGLPVVERAARAGEVRPLDPSQWVVTALNDQHAYVRTPSARDVKVGDWVGFGVSHPCTTFDRWHMIPMVDEEYRVTQTIRTFF